MNRVPGESHIQRLERRTAFWLAAFTALGGALLGVLSDVVPGIGTAGGVGSTLGCMLDSDCDVTPRDVALRVWVAIGLLVLAMCAAWRAWNRWRRRNKLLNERGTVYVVDSPAEGWTPEEKEAFLTAAKTEAAAVAQVPGPTGLTTWRWPLGEGADQWSDAVDDLVLSFRSVWANDDRGTPDSVVCWAPFPVAIAWTARFCAAQRNVNLSFRQRPSAGRAGPIDAPAWEQGVHTFVPPPPNPGVGTTCAARQARLDIVPHDQVTLADGPATRVLLIRLFGANWADVPLDGPAPVDVRFANRSGGRLVLTPEAELHEWRYLREPGQMHPWLDYPTLVGEICDWIADTADPAGDNLIGLLAPQEVQLGIGVNVSRRTKGHWPAHLWPLLKPTDSQVLTVPGLDLGHESLHRTYLSGPRTCVERAR